MKKSQDIIKEAINELIKHQQDPDLQYLQNVIDNISNKVKLRASQELSPDEINLLYHHAYKINNNENIKRLFLHLYEKNFIPVTTNLKQNMFEILDNIAREVTGEPLVKYDIEKWSQDHQQDIEYYISETNAIENNKIIRQNIYDFVNNPDTKSELVTKFNIKDLYEKLNVKSVFSSENSKKAILKKILLSNIEELKQKITANQDLFGLACYYGYTDIANAIIDKYREGKLNIEGIKNILNNDIPLLCKSENSIEADKILTILLKDQYLGTQITSAITHNATQLANYIFLSLNDENLNKKFCAIAVDIPKIIDKIVDKILEDKENFEKNINLFYKSDIYNSIKDSINLEDKIFKYATNNARDDLIDYLLSKDHDAAWINQNSVLDQVFELKETLISKSLRMLKNLVTVKSPDKKITIETQLKKNNELIYFYLNTINKLLDYTNKKNLPMGTGKSDLLLNLYKNIHELYQTNLREAHEEIFTKIFNHQNLNPNSLISLNENKESLFILAIKYNDLKSFESIRDKLQQSTSRSDFISAGDNNDFTPVLYAARANTAEIFLSLVTKGAKLFDNNNSLINSKGITPLMLAYASGNIEVIDLLEEKINNMKKFVTELNRTDNVGNNSLHYLANNYNIKTESVLVGELLQYVDINSKNHKGETPLMHAILNQNASLVARLLNNGADVNIADNFGNTPLIYATLLDNKELVEILLQDNNLNVNKKNIYGISAFYILSARDCRNILTNPIEEIKNVVSENIAKNIPGVFNKNECQGIAEKLLLRGAEGFSGNELGSVLSSIIATFFLTLSPYLAKSVTNGLFPLLGPFSFVYEYASTTMNVFAKRNMHNNMYNNMKLAVYQWLTNGTNIDVRIDIQDQIMIGNYKESFWSIKFGSKLNTQADKTNYYQNYDQAIFTVADFNSEILTQNHDNNWFKKTHENLRAKYINIKQAIANQPWYNKFPLFWKAAALNSIAKEIIKADESLRESQQAQKLFNITVGDKNKSLIEICDQQPNLIQILASPKKSKQLLKRMIDDVDNKNINNIDKIIKLVLDKKIIVPVEVYFNFLQFKTLQDSLKLESKKKLFLNNNQTIDPLPVFEDMIMYDIAEKAKSFYEIDSFVSQDLRPNNERLDHPYVTEAYAYLVDEQNLNKAAEEISTIAATVGISIAQYGMSLHDFEDYVMQKSIADDANQSKDIKSNSLLNYVGRVVKYIASNPFFSRSAYNLSELSLKQLFKEGDISDKELSELIDKTQEKEITPMPNIPESDQAIEIFISKSNTNTSQLIDEENDILLQYAPESSGITTPDGTQTPDAPSTQNNFTGVCPVELTQATEALRQHGVRESPDTYDKNLEASALDNSKKASTEKSQ